MRQDRMGGHGVKLPHVHRVKGRNGEIFKYHRRTRAKLPSNIAEDSPEFIAAWSEQEARETPKATKSSAASDSIAEACETYLGTRAFLDLSDGYRPVIRRHVDAIRLKAGSARLADLRSRHIVADLDPLTPAVGRSRLKAWRKLCAFWFARDMLSENPALQVRAKPMPKSDGHIEWTHADLERFREHWAIGTPQRLAGELLQWTGARASDVVRMGPGMVGRDGILTFRQQKTKGEVFVPWTSPAAGCERDRTDLLALVENTPHKVFLTTNFGKDRSSKSFSQWFSSAASKAGLPHLSAHGLRKYRMNRLAENGASVLQMQAWVGHATLDEIERYTRRAERRRAFTGTL